MSFQWTLIATFLYSEVLVVFLLLLPFISAQRWQKILKSRFLRGLGQQVHIYYYIVLGVLVLCLLDAVREVRRYTDAEEEHSHHHKHSYDIELQNHVKLFRAQRNFYITGFALFLMFVIRRLATLLMLQATLAATSEAAMKQAASATQAAEKLLTQQETLKKGDLDENDVNKMKEEQVKELEAKLEKSRKELDRAVTDLEAMKSQSESVSREYDRLMEDYTKLQHKLKIVEGDISDKKAD